MLENISSILIEMCELDIAKPVVLGVSGGPDSMCLLDVFIKAGYSVLAACLNHGLRSEADAEVHLVQQVAFSLGVDFRTKTVDTPKFAIEAGLSVEAAARQLRYEFLYAEAARINAQAIAVGHTADDQAETVLMHLLRGTGLAGLKGMDFRSFLMNMSTNIPLVRPLLTTWRSEIIEYCDQHNLSTAIDDTNQSINYFRNKLRLDILPYLARYQPNIRQNLVQMANILSTDYELLQNHVEAAWITCVVEQGQGYVALRRKDYITLPPAIQRYMLRKAMLLLRSGYQDIEFAMIERTRQSLKSATGYQTFDIGAGLQLKVEGKIVWLVRRDVNLPMGNWPAVLTDQVVDLPIPCSTELQNGWWLQADRLDARDITIQVTSREMDRFQALFDADLIRQPLYVRHRRPGDRLKPEGMDGKTVKISDLMINLKLPFRCRDNWPVVCSGENIIWVPGCRQSCIASIRGSTRLVVRLRLIQKSDKVARN